MGDWLEGVVRGPGGGAPLGGAEVIVVTVSEGIHISGGKTYQRGYHPSTLTGPDGRFSFSPPDDPFRIIAFHDQGYAEATAQQLAEAHGLTVEPWGRIEGTLRVGGKPLAHETVIASLDEERDDAASGCGSQERESRLRDQTIRARFVIERVTPAEELRRIHWQPERHGARRGRCPIAITSPRSWTSSRGRRSTRIC